MKLSHPRASIYICSLQPDRIRLEVANGNRVLSLLAVPLPCYLPTESRPGTLFQIRSMHHALYRVDPQCPPREEAR